MRRNVIEKTFYDDIREKKKARSGVFHMRGKGVKGGIKGGMKTTYDYLTSKEKRELNGEVKTMNLYKTLMTKEEFDLLTPHEKKMTMTNWRKIHKNQEIIDALGMPMHHYYDLLDELGIERTSNRKPKKTKPIEDMMSYDEFKKLSKDEQKQALEQLRIDYRSEDIQKKWKISSNSFYKLIEVLGIKKKRNNRRNTENNDIKQEVKEKAVAIESAPTQEDVMETKEESQQVFRMEKVDPVEKEDKSEEESPEKWKEFIEKLFDEYKKKQEEVVKVPVQQTPEVESTPNNSTHGFTVNYEEQKEGFLLHQDMKQFIQMLEKNPTTYKIKVSLEKVN